MKYEYNKSLSQKLYYVSKMMETEEAQVINQSMETDSFPIYQYSKHLTEKSRQSNQSIETDLLLTRNQFVETDSQRNFQWIGSNGFDQFDNIHVKTESVYKYDYEHQELSGCVDLLYD